MSNDPLGKVLNVPRASAIDVPQVFKKGQSWRRVLIVSLKSLFQPWAFGSYDVLQMNKCLLLKITEPSISKENEDGYLQNWRMLRLIILQLWVKTSKDQFKN